MIDGAAETRDKQGGQMRFAKMVADLIANTGLGSS